MSTWRKVCCCLFAAVCGASAAFGAVTIQSEGGDGFEVAVSGIQDNTYRIVCVAVGDKDYGGNIADWPFCSSGVLVAADGTVTVPYPAEWGGENTWARAFAYDRLTVADPAATSDYLTDGLVAHWDAIGATSTSEWVDLIGGYTFALNNATVGNKVYAFAKGADSYGELDAESSTAVLGDTSSHVTVEGVFANTGGSDCYVFTGTGASCVFLCYYGATLILSGPGKNDTIAHTYASLATYSVAYNTDTSSNYRHRDRAAVNGTVVGKNGNTYWSRGGTKIQIGGKSPGVGADGACSIGAIRIYNRSLEGWEMKYNADVDKVRFYGGANPTQPVEGSTVIWVHGLGLAGMVTVGGCCCTVEGGGLHGIGEEVTLTATPDASSHFLRWEGDLPEGIDPTSPTMTFTLENSMSVRAVCSRSLTIDAINRDADDKPVSAVISVGVVDAIDTLFCAYGETDGGDDLAAWDHVENVRALLPSETSIVVPFPSGWGEADGPKFLRYFFRSGVEARSVAKNGLAAIWDGIDNVATGAHADETSQWVDLVAGYAFALTGATVKDSSVAFDAATTSYGILGKEASAATFLKSGTVTWEARMTSGDGLAICGPQNSGRMFAPWGSFYTGHAAHMTFSEGSTFRSFNTVGCVFNAGYCSDILVNGVTPSDLRNTTQGWGVAGEANVVVLSGRSSYAINCDIQTMRVYTNELSHADAVLNAEVDKARFKDGVTLGEVESCTETLTPQSDVRGVFKIRASVPHGTVTGAGEYETGETVTLAVAMEEGYTFYRWLGDVPDGVDAYSSEITFTADAHRQFEGFIVMPWETVTDSTGKLVAISNSVWHFAATVSDGEDGVTLSSSAVSSVGQSEAIDKTVDLSSLQRDTGYRLTRLGASAFNGKSRLGSVRLVCEDLLAIGDSAFANSGVTRILPEEVFPNLETVGGSAFTSARRFVAPKLKSVGGSAFQGGGLTNFYPTTITFPMNKAVFYKQTGLRGDFVIDSPTKSIPLEFFGNCQSISSLTVNSPVETIDSWAFYYCGGRCKIYWNVPAPKTLGSCAFGTQSSTGPFAQLICSTREATEGFMKFADGTASSKEKMNFVPIELIDPKYLTKAFLGDAKRSRVKGWFTTTSSGPEGTMRTWLLGPKQGGVLIVR